MLFREIITVCREHRTKHCADVIRILNIKVCGTNEYYHCNSEG